MATTPEIIRIEATPSSWNLHKYLVVVKNNDKETAQKKIRNIFGKIQNALENQPENFPLPRCGGRENYNQTQTNEYVDPTLSTYMIGLETLALANPQDAGPSEPPKRHRKFTISYASATKVGILKQSQSTVNAHSNDTQTQATNTTQDSTSTTTTTQRQVSWDDSTTEANRSLGSSLSRSVTNSKLTNIKKDIDNEIKEIKPDMEERFTRQEKYIREIQDVLIKNAEEMETRVARAVITALMREKQQVQELTHGAIYDAKQAPLADENGRLPFGVKAQAGGPLDRLHHVEVTVQQMATALENIAEHLMRDPSAKHLFEDDKSEEATIIFENENQIIDSDVKMNMQNDISGAKRLHGTVSSPSKQGNHTPMTVATTSPQRSPPPKRERTEDKKTSRQTRRHSPGAGGAIMPKQKHHFKTKKQEPGEQQLRRTEKLKTKKSQTQNQRTKQIKNQPSTDLSKPRDNKETPKGINRTMTNKRHESVYRYTNDESLEYSSSSTEKATQATAQSRDPSNFPQPQVSKKGLSKIWQQIFKKPSILTIKETANRKQQTQPIDLRQTLIKSNPDDHEQNIPFGHLIEAEQEYEGFLFHNINGIKDEHNWMQINLTMLDLNVTGFGFTELNTTLKGLQFRRWNEITRRTFQTSKTITSESDILTDSTYKPGGTATTIVGKWQARISERGSDTSGLGRWSYVIISSNKKKLAVITAYKPCKTTGPTTAWTQQWILLREHNKTPEPIKAFYEDLNTTPKEWRSKGMEILLLIDANEQVGATPGGLGKIIADNDLFDIIANQHNVENYPPTYIRGSKRIDYIFGTNRVQTFCKTSGMLPFGYGYPSDHRAIFV
jgi:hypothetical protein